MDVHRIGGIKYNFDSLEVNELENIHGHLLELHARVVGEIALIESTLFDRRHPQLPVAEVPEDMEFRGDVIWNEYIRHTRDV